MSSGILKGKSETPKLVENDKSDLYKTIVRKNRKKNDLIYVKARVGEIKRSCLDNSKASVKLNWKPQICDE